VTPDGHGTPLHCGRCGAELRPGRGEWYVVEIRTVVEPGPPVFTEEDLAGGTEAAISELLGRLRGMTEAQLRSQVYTRKLHTLCAGCHARWTADPFSAD